MKKALAFLTASIMALGSLPFLSAGAEDAFAPGDVDMDGVLTGHDAALVSRHLAYGDNNLSEEQLKLADYNGDGVVDQTDADAIHENEVWKLGDVDMNGRLNLDDALAILQEYSYAVAGRIVGKLPPENAFTDVQKNLADVGGIHATPTEPTMDQAIICQKVYTMEAAGYSYAKIYPVVDGQPCYFFYNPYE